MPSQTITESWRSSSSFLLGIYALSLSLWCGIAVCVVYWKIAVYMDGLARDTVMQRANLFTEIPPDRLQAALEEHYRLDSRSLNHYGLFDADGTHLSGKLKSIPTGLERDGQVHIVQCISTLPPEAVKARCHALAMPAGRGRILLLTRDNRNSSLTDITEVVISAIVWSTLPMAIPGFLGWYYLRYRPMRRIQAIDAACQKIVAGDLKQRLRISRHRDELDMLCGIVNTMLDRIEKLMLEIKGVSDSIAHDLRTPLTRLRSRLYRMRQQSEREPDRANQLDRAIADTDEVLARFRALLRISELEAGDRCSAFTLVDARSLTLEIHDFYAPALDEKQLEFELSMPLDDIDLHFSGDRSLLFEALGNILGNAGKFTPEHGRILFKLVPCPGDIRFEVHDSGPGIPLSERENVRHRFNRGSQSARTDGHGLGLSIVTAIADLHGFKLQINDSPLGGACVSLIASRHAVQIRT